MHPLEAFSGVQLPGPEVRFWKMPRRPLVSHLINKHPPRIRGQHLMVDSQRVQESAADAMLEFDRFVGHPHGHFRRMAVQGVESLENPLLVFLEHLPAAISLLDPLITQLVDIQHLEHAVRLGQALTDSVHPDQCGVVHVIRPVRVQEVTQVSAERVPTKFGRKI